MKKAILPICLLTLLSACNDVDISKYPKDVQKCYNGIIYNKNNCTKSKKKIVKYCECASAKANAHIAQANREFRESAAMARMFGFGSFLPIAAAGARDIAYRELQQIYNDCAKQTGYTRVANCKK